MWYSTLIFAADRTEGSSGSGRAAIAGMQRPGEAARGGVRSTGRLIVAWKAREQGSIVSNGSLGSIGSVGIDWELKEKEMGIAMKCLSKVHLVCDLSATQAAEDPSCLQSVCCSGCGPN